jgi:pantoate--beta-alanine ligase
VLNLGYTKGGKKNFPKMVCKITKILIANRYFASSARIYMVLFKKTDDLRAWLADRKAEGVQVGFVPTMGALHAGHRALVAQSVADGAHTVCSIFVNPSQFNDPEDFRQYPVTPDADLALLAGAGCHVVFMPEVSEIYPEGMEQTPSFNFGYLETILEGAQRPGHFRGVGQVVGRLLDIVEPDGLYMGQKDYQQCMVVRNLLEQTGRTEEIDLRIMPTVREDDGLAMSSRNRRLTEPQRSLAGIIYQCLVSIRTKQETTPFSIVEKECRELLQAKGIIPEYIAIADARDLRLLADFTPGVPAVALIAVRLGSVRLIDNMIL